MCPRGIASRGRFSRGIRDGRNIPDGPHAPPDHGDHTDSQHLEAHSPPHRRPRDSAPCVTLYDAGGGATTRTADRQPFWVGCKVAQVWAPEAGVLTSGDRVHCCSTHDDSLATSQTSVRFDSTSRNRLVQHPFESLPASFIRKDHQRPLTKQHHRTTHGKKSRLHIRTCVGLRHE